MQHCSFWGRSGALVDLYQNLVTGKSISLGKVKGRPCGGLSVLMHQITIYNNNNCFSVEPHRLRVSIKPKSDVPSAHCEGVVGIWNAKRLQE